MANINKIDKLCASVLKNYCMAVSVVNVVSIKTLSYFLSLRLSGTF